jgi:hypothetical protein
MGGTDSSPAHVIDTPLTVNQTKGINHLSLTRIPLQLAYAVHKKRVRESLGIH